MSCMRRIIISTTETTDTGVILIPNTSVTPTNLSEYRLIIACNVNTPTANEPLYIQTTAGNVPLLCKFGNNLLANQVNKRVNYPLLYGNQNSLLTLGQFIIPSCSCINARGVETTTTTTTESTDTTEPTTNTSTRSSK